MSDRKLCTSVLEKMGVEVPAKISLGRAKKKLERHLAKKGVPTGLTQKERALVLSVGYGVDEAQAKKGGDEKPTPHPGKNKAKKGKKKATADKVEKAKAPRSKGALEVFKATVVGRKSIPRDELIKAVSEKTGCKTWSVQNYIALAKKDDNALGFQLVEKKNKKGERILCKV